MKVAIHQMCSGIDPITNLDVMAENIGLAAKSGAQFYFAPEMSVLIDRDRHRSRKWMNSQNENIWLERFSKAARSHAIWLHIGSMPVACGKPDDPRLANRSIVFDADGNIRARYDKMHLFDVQLECGEGWRESTAYRPGDKVVLAQSPLGSMGLTICYDLRFPYLFSALSGTGARVFAVPAAFTVPTGRAHWHSLLKARAIENAAFVIAAAQTGTHQDGRKTFGHSLVIDPWGDVLLDMGEDIGLGYAEIDLARVDEVRTQIPVLENRRKIPTEITVMPPIKSA
jgi:deaminated glutathione amidase